MMMLPLSSIRLAFDAIFRKSATLQDVNPGDGSVNNSNGGIPGSTANDIPLTPYVPASPSPFKKVQLVSHPCLLTSALGPRLGPSVTTEPNKFIRDPTGAAMVSLLFP